MCSTSDPMVMARAPAYWANKKCRSSMQEVFQLFFPWVPQGFGAFLAGSNCIKTDMLRRLICKHGMNARRTCQASKFSQGTYAASRLILTFLNPQLFLSRYGFRPHGYFRIRRCSKMMSSLCPNNKPIPIWRHKV